jgi:hypothetical protein
VLGILAMRLLRSTIDCGFLLYSKERGDIAFSGRGATRLESRDTLHRTKSFAFSYCVR